MNFFPQRRILARILLFGFVGLVAGGTAVDALAQAPAPLRVDPTLLGLPPVKRDEVPASPEKAKVEVKRVEQPVVDVRPVDISPPVATGTAGESASVREKMPEKPPAQAVVSAKTIERAPPEKTLDAPLPATTASPAVSPIMPAPAPTSAAKAMASSPPVEPLPAPKPSAPKSDAAVTTLGPLRVDPALLGLPPVDRQETMTAGTKTEKKPDTVTPPVAASKAVVLPVTPPQPIVSVPASAPVANVASSSAPVVPVPAPKPVAPKGGAAVTSLGPLRVDPALLGLPPIDRPGAPASAQGGAVVAGASGRSWSTETQPPQMPATGARDEEEVPDPGPALALKNSRAMTPLPQASTEPRPVFLSAYRMGGNVEREFNAEGNAELRKVGTVLDADRLTYWPIEDEVEAEGKVRLAQGENLISGPKMRLRLEDQIGYFQQPTFLLRRQPAEGSKAAASKAFAQQYLEQQNTVDDWDSGFALPRSLGKNASKGPSRGRTMSDGHGEAERIDFEGENQFRLTNSTFTTCQPDSRDWYAKTSELQLDYDQERGEGKEATVYFKDVPIFYSPWLSFSLNNQRKSGFLAPSFGATSDSGLALSVPYYWDIAPNMDATITPREMTKRGLQLGTEFRYLNQAYGGQYRGQARVEVLPGDQLRNEDRYGISLTHTQTTANGFFGLINYNKVSDDKYFTDLSSHIAAISQTQLLQQAQVSYAGGGWWSATANFQKYQTLQPDAENLVSEQYSMLPQITFNARKPDLFMTDSSFMGQYTVFTGATQIIDGEAKIKPDGKRLVLYPQVALPYVQPGWYITPKVGLNIRNYSLSGQASGVPQSISLTVPVMSLDSGMTFERTSRWFGRDYTQTLEPRLYYVNIPYKNQDNIPVFDAALADFNFAQIFGENQFTGWDRINNANQLTAAVTSRLLDPGSGAELVRVMVGQRFYFARNKVALSSNTTAANDDRKWERSDFLSAFSGQILPKVYADLALQYNYDDQKIKRQSIGVRYVPEPGKVLNAAYRYNEDASAPTNQVDFSAQWPLTGKLYGVGRYNYSFEDTGTNQTGSLVQAVAGLEYRGGCWVLRGVVQRVAKTASSTSTAFFIQLELNDFASAGSNPISMLRRNIQGYSLINEQNTDFDYVQ